MPTMRIDAHTHGDMKKLTVSPAEYAASCRARGVERALLIDDPAPCRAAFEALPDFVIPMPWVDIDHVRVPEIHDCFDWGAKGIKFIDPQFSYGDPRYDPLYRAVFERNGVAMFHTGYLGMGLDLYGLPEQAPAHGHHADAAGGGGLHGPPVPQAQDPHGALRQSLVGGGLEDHLVQPQCVRRTQRRDGAEPLAAHVGGHLRP